MKNIIAVMLALHLMISLLQPTYAYELAGREELARHIKADFNGDGVDEETRLVPKTCGSSGLYHYYLEVKSGDKRFVIENEDFAAYYSHGLEKIDVSVKYNPMIGVSRPEGPHGWLLILYAFDGTKVREVANIFSDGPSIDLKDVDNDGDKEIVVNNRDYGHNPVEDRFISTIKYDGAKWQTVSCYETGINGCQYNNLSQEGLSK